MKIMFNSFTFLTPALMKKRKEKKKKRALEDEVPSQLPQAKRQKVDASFFDTFMTPYLQIYIRRKSDDEQDYDVFLMLMNLYDVIGLQQDCRPLLLNLIRKHQSKLQKAINEFPYPNLPIGISLFQHLAKYQKNQPVACDRLIRFLYHCNVAFHEGVKLFPMSGITLLQHYPKFVCKVLTRVYPSEMWVHVWTKLLHPAFNQDLDSHSMGTTLLHLSRQWGLDPLAALLQHPQLSISFLSIHYGKFKQIFEKNATLSHMRIYTWFRMSCASFFCWCHCVEILLVGYLNWSERRLSNTSANHSLLSSLVLSYLSPIKAFPIEDFEDTLIDFIEKQICRPQLSFSLNNNVFNLM
jgi:hypothetical protein